MSSELVADFFAIVLLGAALGLPAILLLVPGQRQTISASVVPLAAIVAVGATAGSLYFSEIANFTPCELCWFQRIFMYPMAVIFLVAAIRKDRGVFVYALPLSVIGFAIAAYHIQLQLFPEQSSFCEVTNPCTSSAVKALGFMTIPHMSAISFALIISLAFISRRLPEEPHHEQ